MSPAKSIYVAKLAERIWGDTLHDQFILWTFQQSTFKPRVYFTRNGSKILLLYVVSGKKAFASSDPGLMPCSKYNVLAGFNV